MKFLIVVGTVVLVLAVLAGVGFYVLQNIQTAETLPITSPTTSVVTQQGESINGHCVPAIVIETLQVSDQRVGDLYQECIAQTNQGECQRIDRFHYDKGTWRPDGKSDCEWREENYVQPRYTLSKPAECVWAPRNAKGAANTLLAAHGIQWGEVENITYSDERSEYAVQYQTPQEELPFLGERTVLVNCETNVATLVPRK